MQAVVCVSVYVLLLINIKCIQWARGAELMLINNQIVKSPSIQNSRWMTQNRRNTIAKSEDILTGVLTQVRPTHSRRKARMDVSWTCISLNSQQGSWFRMWWYGGYERLLHPVYKGMVFESCEKWANTYRDTWICRQDRQIWLQHSWCTYMLITPPVDFSTADRWWDVSL